MSTSKHGVIVGVTGPGEDTATWAWAAEAARRRGVGVTLVHALRTMIPPPPPTLLITYEPLFQVADELVHEAAEQFTALTGAEPAGTSVVQGAPGPVLAELSEEAELVVVGHRHVEGVRRLLTRSTAVAVATHAHCPVAVVPDTDTGSVPRRWVTVGVHESGVPEVLLEAAFEEAAARGSALRALHAWRADPAYDAVISERLDLEWRQRVADEVTTALAPWRTRFPAVEAVVDVRHDWPADALVEATEDSQLLVVGRSQNEHLPHWLGSMTRTLVKNTRGPLLVVPV